MAESIDLPLLYRGKSLLGTERPLSNQLKIFAFDDSTMAALKDPHISITQWADIIAKVNDQKPARIIIDKLFTYVGSEQEFQAAKQRISQIPTYVPVFLSPYTIKGREAIHPPAFDLTGPLDQCCCANSSSQTDKFAKIKFCLDKIKKYLTLWSGFH